MIAFFIGLVIGFGLSYLGLILFFKHINLIKVDFDLVLKGEDMKVIKSLNKFTKFYWNEKSFYKDAKEMMAHCEDIRSNIKFDDNYLADMIDENFELDVTKVYLNYETHAFKPL